jgi:hypothetical protein
MLVKLLVWVIKVQVWLDIHFWVGVSFVGIKEINYGSYSTMKLRR